jgi:hypothetical protein
MDLLTCLMNLIKLHGQQTDDATDDSVESERESETAYLNWHCSPCSALELVELEAQ